LIANEMSETVLGMTPAESHSNTASAPRRRVLYLTHRVPYPPNRGDRIRSYHTLRFLSARADVDLACLADEPVSDECRAVLDGLCRRVAVVPLGRRLRWLNAFNSVARGRSATEGLFHSAALADTVRNWASQIQYDSVLAFCSSMAQYLDTPQLQSARRVVDLVDVDSQKWFDYAEHAYRPASWLFRCEGRRVRKLELQLAQTVDALTVVSSAEADLLRRDCPQAPIHAVPNGVDLDYFQPGTSDAIATEPECVFVGALDYRPNIDGVIWFCQEVWPQIVSRFPTANLVIVGRNPVAQIRNLGTRSGVEIVADVPDVRPYLRRATIVIVPLRIARGIQNKVLEALAFAKPVIASPQALEGVSLVSGKQVIQAETSRQWVAAVSKLLVDVHERRRLSAAGRMFVSEHHHWEHCLWPLDQWLELCSTSSAGRSRMNSKYAGGFPH
jgi:polysaccharide biosynthesis protein PslH